MSFYRQKEIIVVGYDGNYADVLEGALKVLETVRQGVTGYDIEEFSMEFTILLQKVHISFILLLKVIINHVL